MLTHYYPILDALLPSSEGKRVLPVNVLDFAVRGMLRIAFWYSGVLEDGQQFRGYLQVPREYVEIDKVMCAPYAYVIETFHPNLDVAPGSKVVAPSTPEGIGYFRVSRKSVLIPTSDLDSMRRAHGRLQDSDHKTGKPRSADTRVQRFEPDKVGPANPSPTASEAGRRGGLAPSWKREPVRAFARQQASQKQYPSRQAAADDIAESVMKEAAELDWHMSEHSVRKTIATWLKDMHFGKKNTQ